MAGGWTERKEGDEATDQTEKQREVDGRAILDDFINYPLTDIGSSKLYADMYKHELCFVREMGVYFFYNGKAWIKDVNSVYAKRLAKRFAISTIQKASKLPDDETRKVYVKYYNRFNSFGIREKLVRDAQTVYLAEYADFDKKPHLYNCQNGTFNLKTGKLQPHRAADMLTQISNVEYKAGAKCGRWEQYIHEIMSGDVQSMNLLQMIAGYCLSGSTKFECFFMLYGKTTRNGKGTFNSTMMKMHGDYSKVLNPESLSAKSFYSNSEAPNESIASLAGARYVCVSEPGEGLRLDSDLIKTLTGGDPIKARFLRQNSFIFVPNFKIVINTNFLPKIQDDTIFASDRLVLLNFNQHFDHKKRDGTLKNVFTNPENMSGIFNWCYEGYGMLDKAGGFHMPDKSKALFEQYREESDPIRQFIAEVLTPAENERLKFKAVYGRYKEWAQDNGYKSCSRGTFKQRVEKVIEVKDYGGQDWIFGYDFQ